MENFGRALKELRFALNGILDKSEWVAQYRGCQCCQKKVYNGDLVYVLTKEIFEHITKLLGQLDITNDLVSCADGRAYCKGRKDACDIAANSCLINLMMGDSDESRDTMELLMEYSRIVVLDWTARDRGEKIQCDGNHFFCESLFISNWVSICEFYESITRFGPKSAQF